MAAEVAVTSLPGLFRRPAVESNLFDELHLNGSGCCDTSPLQLPCCVGRDRLVRHGHGPERTIQTAGHFDGPAEVAINVFAEEDRYWDGVREPAPPQWSSCKRLALTIDALSRRGRRPAWIPIPHPILSSLNWEKRLMARGTVKWFNPTKGYGFIQPQVARAGIPGRNA